LLECRFNKNPKKIPGKGGSRYWKHVGLGIKTPKEAMEGA
jgi:small subunit ribosomal protein S11e